MDFPQKIITSLEQARVNVAAGVPDNWLEPVLAGLASTEAISYTPAAREEDALGICCGAALSGVRAVCLMQSVGTLNTGGALSTLAVSYGIPLVMLVSDRGHLGDVTIAHFMKGRAFRPFLEALRIPFYELNPDFVETGQVDQAFQMAEIGQSPVALLITKKSMEETE